MWAIKALGEKAGFFLRRVSSIYLTEPVGFSSDKWFYNLVIEIETSFSPWEVFLILRALEKKAGRERRGKISDRTLDLDLLLYEDLVLKTDLLTIPHPRLHQRRFVMVPLVEINPLGRHPLMGQQFKTLLAQITDNSQVKRVARLKCCA